MAMATLVDELIEEILLRLPPSNPSCLFRAAVTCKRWRAIVSDAGFHRAPPVIGAAYTAVDGDAYVARFTPFCSSGPSPPRAADRHGAAVLDCHHGRVLLRAMPPATGERLDDLPSVPSVTVWDPVAGEQWEVRLPYVHPYTFYDVVVLCAGTGNCDHLDCHGGPFVVVVVGTDLDDIFVYTYSSKTAAWSEASKIHLETRLRSHAILRPGLVAVDKIYFMLLDGHKVVKYDLGGHVTSMINPPLTLHPKGKVTLMETKDGGLGVADLEGNNLHIWSRQAAGSNGAERWVKDQVIKLDTVLSVAIGGLLTEFDVVGFGEGTDIILINANDGIFVVWRNSGRVMKQWEQPLQARDQKLVFQVHE